MMWMMSLEESGVDRRMTTKNKISKNKKQSYNKKNNKNNKYKKGNWNKRKNTSNNSKNKRKHRTTIGLLWTFVNYLARISKVTINNTTKNRITFVMTFTAKTHWPWQTSWTINHRCRSASTNYLPLVLMIKNHEPTSFWNILMDKSQRHLALASKVDPKENVGLSTQRKSWLIKLLAPSCNQQPRPEKKMLLHSASICI